MQSCDPARERIVVDCFLGSNWVLTVHSAEIAVLDDFREVAEGKGEVGPPRRHRRFSRHSSEWVVTSYLRAFDEIEETLDEFDVKALAHPSNDPEEQIEMLGDARRRVGRLRRTLAPHREVFAALSHSEFDPLSSEASAERFVALTARVDAALASARDVRDGIASSFDVLIVRTEHRTNEIMKVLTLASILLLPGALLAGVAGMNVNISAHTFAPLATVLGRGHRHHPDRDCNTCPRTATTVDLSLTDASFSGSHSVAHATSGAVTVAWASVPECHLSRAARFLRRRAASAWR